MIAVKIVATFGDGPEVEIGPFNQGVVLEFVGGGQSVIDVATSEQILNRTTHGFWYPKEAISDLSQDIPFYDKIFIQSV